MVTILIFLLRLIAPPVDASNVAVAYSMGDTESDACDAPLAEQPWDCAERMRWALLTISNRESPGNWSPGRRYVGVHEGDSKHAGSVYKWATKFERLSEWCPFHDDEEGMSTVGPHGLMYGYNVQRLGVPGNCVPPWLLGIGPVSARAAGHRYVELCNPRRWATEPGGWCPTIDQVVRTEKRARRIAWRQRRSRSM